MASLNHPYYRFLSMLCAGWGLCLVLLVGVPAYAEQSFWLDDDIEIRYRTGSHTSDFQQAHLFDVKIIEDGILTGIADEFKLKQTKSPSGHPHILDELFIRNALFSPRDEEISIEVARLDASDIVLSSPPSQTVDTAEDITAYFLALPASSFLVSDIKIISPDEGGKFTLGSAELSSQTRKRQNGSGFVSSNRIVLSDIMLGFDDPDGRLNTMPDMLKHAGLSQLSGAFSAETDISFDGSEFDLTLTTNLIADNLFDINLAISGLVDKAIASETSLFSGTIHDGEPEITDEQLARIMGLTHIRSADIRIADKGGVELAGLAYFEPFLQIALAEYSASIAQMARQPLSDFVNQGGSLSVSARPKRPVNLLQLGILGLSPDLAISLLGLTFSHE